MIRNHYISAVLMLLAVIICTASTPSSASDALAAGRIDEATSQLRARVQANAQDAEAHHLLSRAYYSIQRWDDAISSGERAVALQPNNSVYHLWLGRAYGEKAGSVNFLKAMDLAKKVRDQFEKAVQLDGSNVAARADLAEFYVEAPGFLGGGKDKAREQAKYIAQKDPARSHWVLAIIAEKDKKYDVAEQELRTALQISGNQSRYWLDLASFYRRRGRLDDMENAISKAIASTGSDKQTFFDAANTLFRAGRNFAAATQYLRTYISGGHYSYEAPLFQAHYLLGSVLEKAGDKQGAAREYRASLSLAKDYKRAQTALNRVQ
ncbi:MAG TPA: tetratricopeptide repeat protein [Terriglobales bacterium]|nr:tetratricopeptide repeat protein [Terriglobales bacterium]